jgi:hypothetical protein
MNRGPAGAGETPVKSVLVYRLEGDTKAVVPVGILMDRRNHERGDNAIGMLRMAKREFAESEKEAANLFIKYE